MCTASWIHTKGGYQLLFNRDEKRTRLSALPPRVEHRRHTRVVAPVDGDHGGAWLAVNDRGVTVCLLNGAATRTGLRSRGLLLSELAGARTATEAIDQLSARDLAPYAPFTLAALEPHQPAAIARWDGVRELSLECAGHAPLCSSSYDAEGVLTKRRHEFLRLASRGPLTAARLFEFHRSHGLAPSAYSTCMHRRDAETVSFSWISVTPASVSFFYSPAAPCHWLPGENTTLPRTA